MKPMQVKRAPETVEATSRMKRAARWLLAGAVLAVGWNFASSQIAQRSGPFAYFNDLPGPGATYDKGKRQIDDWVTIGADPVTALQMLSAAGFACHFILRPTRNPKYLTAPPTPISEKETSEDKFYQSRCHYSFGFFGEDWYAGFESNGRQQIIRSSSGITPVLDM
jgi:hypothetical protein